MTALSLPVAAGASVQMIEDQAELSLEHGIKQREKNKVKRSNKLPNSTRPYQ